MAEPATTFVSVDRARLKANRATGGCQPVIRVQRGTTTSLATEAEILGPSRVKYGLDPPPGVPNVWIETEADVRVGDEPAGDRSRPVAGSGLRRPEPLLSRLLQTNLLEQAIRKVEADLAREPRRPDLLRRLGELQRQIGDRSRALATYEALQSLAPEDPSAARLVAILKGHAIPAGPWPEPFVVDRDFLPDERLDELLAFTAGHRGAFVPTPVVSRGGNPHDASARWCENLKDVAAVAGWLVPMIQARLPMALAQLGLPQQPLEIRDCRLSHYGDRGFFGPHVDRGAGAETRILGLLLNFHFPPKRFAGGGLAIYDRDPSTGRPATSCTTIVPEQNQLVLHGSDCWHEVVPVRCPDEWSAGRFTLNGWNLPDAVTVPALVPGVVARTDSVHRAFGLVIRSCLPLPELLPAFPGPEVDTEIVYERVPADLPDRVACGAGHQATADRLLLQVDGVARFLISLGRRVAIDRMPGAEDEDIRLYLLGWAFGALLHQRQDLVLHGSAVVRGKESVAFLGFSGVGKSTLASAFRRRGHLVLTDDLCVVRPLADGRMAAHPGFPQTKLWLDSLERLDLDPESRRLRRRIDKRAVPLGEAFAPAPAPLKKIYLLRPVNRDELALMQVQGPQKFAILKNHTYRFGFLAGVERRAMHFEHALKLAQQVPLAVAVRPRGSFELEALVALIEADLHA